MLFRITTVAEWESVGCQALYAPAELADGGFIHLCTAAQVAFVLERHFAGRTGLVLLEIDPARVQAEIRYERSEPGLEPFPHVYGPIPREAITRVITPKSG